MDTSQGEFANEVQNFGLVNTAFNVIGVLILE